MASLNKGIIIASTIGAGGIGAGSYYGYHTFNKETKDHQQKPPIVNIGSKLKSEKYTLLKADSKNFNEVLTNYKTSIKSPDTPDFEGFNGEGKDNETAEAILLRHCQTILKNEKLDSGDYAKAKKWCVEPITVTSLLKARGVTALEIADSPGELQTQWSNKVKAYRSSQESRIEGLAFTSSKETSPTSDEITNIKNSCKGIKDKKNHEDKFEENLKAFKAWCSNN
ncbi:hypothetical protein A6V39_00475 [Candidatus Mycoplasma haematobovis]|uniref:Uncharacterized protein n=1 Tax=Candidatus Mycoplasma haematobovis TaxID=432608 RepID=A0A1A9QEY4_9MOLU|nr:hypothetical protein [Candidatus Mycoplasma haematobovis]OAL10525.1 hypothetical protein A6V39_00475 [Candidatus Mycoplasma haematobovis]